MRGASRFHLDRSESLICTRCRATNLSICIQGRRHSHYGILEIGPRGTIPRLHVYRSQLIPGPHEHIEVRFEASIRTSGTIARVLGGKVDELVECDGPMVYLGDTEDVRHDVLVRTTDCARVDEIVLPGVHVDADDGVSVANTD